MQQAANDGPDCGGDISQQLLLQEGISSSTCFNTLQQTVASIQADGRKVTIAYTVEAPDQGLSDTQLAELVGVL